MSPADNANALVRIHIPSGIRLKCKKGDYKMKPIKSSQMPVFFLFLVFLASASVAGWAANVKPTQIYICNMDCGRIDCTI